MLTHIPNKRAAIQSWLIELISSTIKPDLQSFPWARTVVCGRLERAGSMSCFSVCSLLLPSRSSPNCFKWRVANWLKELPLHLICLNKKQKIGLFVAAFFELLLPKQNKVHSKDKTAVGLYRNDVIKPQTPKILSVWIDK